MAATTAVVTWAVAAVVRPVGAATPSKRTLDAAHPSTTWRGAVFRHRRTTPGPVCPPGAVDAGNVVCDHVAFAVDVPSSFWSSRTGGLLISITWANPADNFDLYLYGPNGRIASGCRTPTGACQATSPSGGSEELFLPSASGTYELRVSPLAVTDEGYGGQADFVSSAKRTEAGAGQRCGDLGDAYCPGVDASNWYWLEQIERRIAVPPNRTLTVRLPNPEASDTLPVALVNGKPEKESALKLDLAARGIAPPARISSFVLTMAEDVPGGKNETDDETNPNVVPEYNVARPGGATAKIQACPATTQWAPTAGAELWPKRPAFDQSGCALGTRDDSDPRAPTWSFDLTSMAQGWIDAPASNQGVVLVPDAPGKSSLAARSWQVNFRLPRADDPRTTNDEYAETKFKTTFDMKEAQPSNGSDGGSSGTGGAPPSAPPIASAAAGTVAGPAPSSDFTVVQAPGRAASSLSSTTASAPVPTIPRVPWWVWLVVGFGLTGLVGARAALFEVVPTARPDGVIAGIRRRNASRGGVPEARTSVATGAMDVRAAGRRLLRRAGGDRRRG